MSTSADAELIAPMLVGAGFSAPAIASGGDDTITLCEEIDPDVVVLCASLEQGDARSLASSLRVTPGGSRMRIVLVGDASGPIRNALDASDFEVDRFVGRPLAAKALVFAVRTCAEEAYEAAERAARETLPEPYWPTPRPLPPPLHVPARIPIMRTATMPGTGPSLPPGPSIGRPRRAQTTSPGLEAAMDEAITRFVSDAMSALDFGRSFVPDRSGQVEQTVDDPTVRNAAAVGAAVHGPVDSSRQAPEAASSWQEPPPTWREPTLVLPGGGQGQARVRAPRVIEPAEPVRAEVPPDDARDQGSEPGERAADSSGNGAPAEGEAPGDDGPKSSLARELRRKMSMMAERLFPGRTGDRSRLDVGLAHDAHAEIDLAALGLEGGGSAPYDAGPDSFAESSPLGRLDPGPSEAAGEREETTGRRRSISSEPPARGDLADIDVATLLGRLLQNRFTGRVQFRRGAAEKTIHFEDGRPVFAVSNLPHDRMGDLLYREGKITREQQQRARDLVVESGRRMGEILVEIGFLKPRELLPAVRHHIEDIAYSLFAWETGEFAITAGDPTSERIRLTRHPAAIVLEGVRRKYGPELLEARLGSPAAVVAVRSQRELGAIAAVADLSSSERAVIQKLDGERTIQQVAEAAQVDHLVALQLAFALIALGVAEVVDSGAGAAERAPRSRSLVGETDIAIDRQRVLAKHALVHEADYFTLLGVRRDATSFEIRRAYEAARRDYAVSGFPSELQRELAGELGEINRVLDEAYQVLRDEQVRRSYQANLLD